MFHVYVSRSAYISRSALDLLFFLSLMKLIVIIAVWNMIGVDTPD